MLTMSIMANDMIQSSDISEKEQHQTQKSLNSPRANIA